MDRKIYFPTAHDNGRYAARRIPRGQINPADAIVSGAGGIPTYLNPSPIALGAMFQDVGQHTYTERFTYQVPQGRRAIIQSAIAHSEVRTASGGGIFTYESSIWIIRNGARLDLDLALGYKYGVPIVHARRRSNGLGDFVNGIHTGEVELFEGDYVKGVTSHNAADGLSAHRVAAAIIEYNATEPVRQSSFQSTTGFIGAPGGTGTQQTTSGNIFRGDPGVIDRSTLYRF